MPDTAPDTTAPEPDDAGDAHDAEVVTEDVTWLDHAGGEKVSAWLVRPSEAGRGPGPGILFWHWLDTEAPDGNRDEFLPEARALASRGVVSLLPQGRFPWSIDPSGSAADAAEVGREVARLRQGLDRLAEHPDVDESRLAVVGHDFGAMLAVLAAAEDPRVTALALIAPTPRWADWFLPFWRIDEDRITYLAAMRPLDPVEVIGRVAPRPMLLQFGRRDFFIPLMAGLELRRAAGGEGAADLQAYDAEHDLHDPAARADRTAFLERVLRLPAD
jgi:dienelactone hydrolase